MITSNLKKIILYAFLYTITKSVFISDKKALQQQQCNKRQYIFYYWELNI